MKNTLETRLGLFVALIVLASVLIIETLGGVSVFKKQYQVHALFNTAQDLKVGDRVKMAGVEIGRVKDIALTDNKVKISMTVSEDALKKRIRTDSVASVRFTGLMGQNYVNVDFGSPGAPNAAPDTILATAEQPDLNAIMAKLDNVASGVENLTKSFSGDKIDNILGPFTDFLKQNSGPLTATIANIRSMSAQIAEGKGTVGKLIYDDALYSTALTTVSNLQFTTDEIKLTLADARKVIDGVNAGEGSLGKLVKDETLYRETTASMTNLKEILQKINNGQGTVGKLVNDQEFYRNAKLTLQKVDKATEGLEDQGPLSVMGILVNNLF
ncbi:MAG: MCE family protein [Verrucomicrobia bacterium]|nr:MAG: MCE family protein [Verrucomicrobiota bacterium]